MLAKTISFFIQKGGTGKTACVANAGAGLARMGKRVLAVDLDPQGNLAISLGATPGPITSYHLLAGHGEDWRGALCDIDISGPDTVEGGRLAVLPGSLDLAAIDREISGQDNHVFRLKEALGAVRGEFDYILFDNPPTVNAAVINGLGAADCVLAPVRADFLSVAGVTQLVNTIQLAKEGGVNPDLRFAGIILTFFDGRTNLSKMAAAQLKEAFGDIVFDTAIRETVTVGEAPACGNDIFRYAPSSAVAEDFRKLCREIESKL